MGIESDIVDIVSPETDVEFGRSRTYVASQNDNFYIYIEAPDTGSLRASLGSIARIFRVIKDVEGIIDG
ncbi:MAG: KEOPS complex subunit Pcc1 [Thermoplasmata archaeon]